MQDIINVEYNDIFVKDESLTGALQRAEAEINTLTVQANKMALTYIIAIGQRLSEAKEMLAHGQWGKWCSERINYSQSTAENYIKLYKEYGSEQVNIFGPSDKILNLPYSKALALLAVPETEREEFVQENDVDKLSVRELQNIIKSKEDEIIALNNDISSKEAQNKKLKSEKDAVISGLRHKITALENEIEAAENEIEAAHKQDEEPQNDKIVESLKKKLKEAQGEIAKLESISENSSKLHVINMLLENLQDIFYKIASEIKDVSRENVELADKLTKGTREVLNDFMYELGGEELDDETR